MLRTMVDGSPHMDPIRVEGTNLITFVTMGLTMIEDNVHELVF